MSRDQSAVLSARTERVLFLSISISLLVGTGLLFTLTVGPRRAILGAVAFMIAIILVYDAVNVKYDGYGGEENGH